MRIPKYFRVMLVALTATVCQAEIAIEAPPPDAQPENRSTPSIATPGQVAPKVAPLRLAIDLVDGSRITGIADITSIPVQMAYARIDIPLAQVVTIVIGRDRETASLELQNGDRLTAVLLLAPLELEMIFGSVSVGIGAIKSISVIRGAAVASGLVAHYSFDKAGETVQDESKGGYHGKVHRATWSQNGKLGGAYAFHGNNDYLLLPADALDVAKGDFTVSAWIKIDSYGNWRGIVRQGNIVRSPVKGFGLYILNSGQLDFRIRRGQDVIDAKSEILGKGQWCHVAGVRTSNDEKTTLRIYVNGILSESSSGLGAYDASTGSPIYIGKGYVHFDGAIDEVRIHDRALSAVEIRQLCVLD
jgi:hypothetical protein